MSYFRPTIPTGSSQSFLALRLLFIPCVIPTTNTELIQSITLVMNIEMFSVYTIGCWVCGLLVTHCRKVLDPN
jgi:hypothetical protein